MFVICRKFPLSMVTHEPHLNFALFKIGLATMHPGIMRTLLQDISVQWLYA